MPRLIATRLLLIAMSLSAFLGAELAAAPKKSTHAPSKGMPKPVSARVIEVPKTAGAEEVKSVDRSVKSSEGPRLEFAKSSSPSVKSAPSVYTMDGSKQDQAYEFVSIPVGGFSGSDNLKSTGSGSK